MELDNVRYFNGTSEATDQALANAIACFDDTDKAEKILLNAFDQSSEELGAYVALYKFYFYKNRLRQAQETAYQALAKAAELGKLPFEWREQQTYAFVDCNPDSPQRIYLYTMKALAFMYLRDEQCDTATEILDKLELLDPADVVGGSVIRSIAKRMCADENDWYE